MLQALLVRLHTLRTRRRVLCQIARLAGGNRETAAPLCVAHCECASEPMRRLRAHTHTHNYTHNTTHALQAL